MKRRFGVLWILKYRELAIPRQKPTLGETLNFGPELWLGIAPTRGVATWSLPQNANDTVAAWVPVLFAI